MSLCTIGIVPKSYHPILLFIGVDDLSEEFSVCKVFSADWLGIKKTTLDNIKKDCDDVNARHACIMAKERINCNPNLPGISCSQHSLNMTAYKLHKFASKFICEHGQ